MSEDKARIRDKFFWDNETPVVAEKPKPKKKTTKETDDKKEEESKKE